LVAKLDSARMVYQADVEKLTIKNPGDKWTRLGKRIKVGSRSMKRRSSLPRELGSEASQSLVAATLMR